MSKITTNFIRDKYNIENEKKFKKVKKIVSEKDCSEIFKKTQMSKEELLENFENLLNIPTDFDFIELIYYGYDGGTTMVFKKEEEVLESEQETIERLKKMERTKRIAQKEIEKAKKILEKYGEIQ